MSAQEAVEILNDIGNIYAETAQIFPQTFEEKKEQQIADEVALVSERKSPFSFYKCGIKDGEEIIYIHNPEIVCTVANDRTIRYNGKITSLSALAKKLLGRKNGVQGTLHFMYRGEVLSALRKRLEDEGKYSSEKENAQELSVNSKTAETEQSGDVILYCIMKKYRAVCKITDGRYLLLKGSKIAPECSAHCNEWIKNLRLVHNSKK